MFVINFPIGAMTNLISLAKSLWLTRICFTERIVKHLKTHNHSCIKHTSQVSIGIIISCRLTVMKIIVSTYRCLHFSLSSKIYLYETERLNNLKYIFALIFKVIKNSKIISWNVEAIYLTFFNIKMLMFSRISHYLALKL